MSLLHGRLGPRNRRKIRGQGTSRTGKGRRTAYRGFYGRKPSQGGTIYRRTGKTAATAQKRANAAFEPSKAGTGGRKAPCPKRRGNRGHSETLGRTQVKAQAQGSRRTTPFPQDFAGSRSNSQGIAGKARHATDSAQAFAGRERHQGPTRNGRTGKSLAEGRQTGV